MGGLVRLSKKIARAVDRQRLREIKVRLREIRRSRPERLRAIRASCRVARENVRARVLELRKQTRDELRERVKNLREAQRGDCRTTEAAARDELNRKISAAALELDSERDRYRAQYGRKKLGRTTAREKREEDDDEVRRNLPAELVAVFNKVRRQIHASPRRTRTEAFLEWVHDNPDDAHAIIYDAVEADVAKLVAEQEAIEGRRRGRYRAEHVMEAPF